MKTKIIGYVTLIAFLFVAAGVVGVMVWKNIDAEKPAIGIEGVYDEDGNLISRNTAQATVGGVSGVKFIKLAINVKNIDTVPLTFKVVDASPQRFGEAVDFNEEKIAEPNEYATFISDLIDIEDFEGTVQEFTATVEGSSNARQSSTKTSSVLITIDEDPVSVFDVEINDPSGNNEPEFPEPMCTIDSDCDEGNICEDEICVEAPEPEIVQFRTTDLSYATGAVAFSSSCGQTLTAYGRTGGACTEHTCDDTDQDYNIISASGTTKMWVRDSENLCICIDGADSGGSRRYDVDDSDASLVDTSIELKDASREMVC